MSEIQQSRYDQLLRRVADLKGPGSKVSDALGDLFPVIDVERVPGELLLLSGTALCVGASQVTGAAGERPRISVFNPVGSGKLLTVTRYIASSLATSVIRTSIQITPLTSGIGTEVFRDGRRTGQGRPTGQMRTDSLVAIVDANTIIRASANVIVDSTDENGLAVLSPGRGFEVGTELAAGVLLCTIFWRERIAQPSELNL